MSGVGDKAYFASVGTAHGASNTLAALSGTVAVFVTVLLATYHRTLADEAPARQDPDPGHDLHVEDGPGRFDLRP